MPLFCASRDKVSETGIIGEIKDYRIVDTVYKTGDGGILYQGDMDFLQNCLLFAICTQYNACDSNSKFWEVSQRKLDRKRKETEIYKIYNFLSTETGINGLKNLESYNKDEFGKLWREHNLYPKVTRLKVLLEKYNIEKIRPKMLKYGLLK